MAGKTDKAGSGSADSGSPGVDLAMVGSSTKPVGGGRSLLLLVAGLCLGLGAVVATVVLWDRTPVSLLASDGGGVVVVSQREFTDSRMVSLSVGVEPAQALVAPSYGRLTSRDCVVGDVVASGTSSVSIDGVPVVSLFTEMPLWRDLRVGVSGGDVASFGAELVRLGRLTEVPSSVTSAMVNAYRSLAIDLGVDASVLSSSYVSVSQIAWLPAPVVAVAGCQVAVGAYVNAGEVLFGFAPSIMSARITTDVSQLTPGVRMLRVGGVDIPVDSDGVVSSPEALAMLAATQVVRQQLMVSGNPQIQGQYVLAEPIQVSVVPPTAITAAGGVTCVVSNSVPYRVTVVASELGQSFVTFSAAPPTVIELLPSRDTVC
jgi:hypothetical protein